jgi:hypothetical protein
VAAAAAQNPFLIAQFESVRKVVTASIMVANAGARVTAHAMANGRRRMRARGSAAAAAPVPKTAGAHSRNRYGLGEGEEGTCTAPLKHSTYLFPPHTNNMSHNDTKKILLL